jgi:predicted nucleic acid-binding Zn ribbon protein
MKKQNEQTLKQAIEEMLAAYGLTEKTVERRLQQQWPEIAGHTIARYTTAIRLNGTVLHLSLSSAPLRQELSYRKAELLALIQKTFPDSPITEIRFYTA